MKKIYSLLFLSVFCLMAFGQLSVAPKNMQFSKMNVGPFLFEEGLGASSNPIGNYEPAYDSEDGYRMYSGGQMGADKTANRAAFESAWNIVDMSAVGAGKVLLVKGVNSKVPEGNAANGVIPGWLGIHLYSNATDYPADQRVRVKMTFAMAPNEGAEGADGLIKIGVTSTAMGDITAGGLKENAVFNTVDYLGQWVTVETDLKPTEAAFLPIRVKLSLAANKIDNAAIYIKDIELIPVLNTVPELLSWQITEAPFSHIPSSVEQMDMSRAQAYSSNGALVVEGIEAGESYAVYNSLGAVVAQGVAINERFSLNLNKGLYVIKLDSKSIKVVL